jgi:gluconolactonase
MYKSIAILAMVLVAMSCKNKQVRDVSTTSKKDSLTGKIELYDPAAATLIDTNARFEIIGEKYTWSEGPLWVPSLQKLLFSDVLENKIYQWKAGVGTSLYLSPSGYTDTAKRDGENGSNGLALDKNGRLLLCQSGNRVVARLNSSIDNPLPSFTVLSSNYQGKKFNSPNDLVADSKNNIYFTDPIYGLPKGESDTTRELTFEGVYRISADGKTSLLIDSISRPNGIALAADEKTLYVASSDAEHPRWYAYQLDDAGMVKSGGILLDATEMKSRAVVKQGADGFKLDAKGNIFSAGPDGINIISPAGKRLALIKVYGRRCSNCAFNEDKSSLFLTADDVVIKLDLHSTQTVK